MKFRSIIVFVFISFLSIATFAQTFTLHVNITNIRNTKGKMQVQIFKNQEDFDNAAPWKSVLIVKATTMKGNTITYDVTGIPAGTYGIAILDDENTDTKMNYSFMLPTEGFGFSNYYHTAWSKPKFDSFKFTVNAADVNINIKVRYV